MRIATIFTVILFATLVLSATQAVAKDEIYRWVDENGVVHFGDRPDGQTNSEVIEIKSDPGTSAPAYSAPTATDSSQQEPSVAEKIRIDRAERRKEAAEQQEAIDAGCEQRHQLVAQLEPSTRVIVEYEDGSIGRLDDNERLETLAEAKAYIAEKCDN